MQPIEIQSVTKDFGQGRGVFDISFSVKKGEVFGYLGPNGAGKSTTIRQLMGFVKPQKGSLKVLGMDCFRQAAEIHKQIGYLAGEIAFADNMSGMEYIRFIAQLRGMKDDTHMKELLEMFEFNPTGKIRKMSKGMKQKIALVTAFMDSPQVLILDEPTSGLDPLMQNRFVDLILEEKKKGTTILMSSHIFEEVERTCDRTAIIRQGKIVDTVDMAELSKIRNQVYTVTLSDEERAVKLSGQPKLSEMLQGYQDALPEMMAAVGMTGVAASLIEWIQIYLYGFIMLLFPLIFIIIAVNKLVMGFIDNGSIAGILATPNSRGKFIVTQLISLYVWLFILMVCISAVGIVSSNMLFPEELDIEKYIFLNAGTLMLWFAVAGITFLASCIFSDAKYYYFFGAGIPMLFFFFNMMGNMGENLKFFKYATIYSLLPADKLIAGNSDAILPCVILLLICIVLSIVGGVWFTKRDLSL